MLARQFLRQAADALAGPTQGGIGVASGRRLDQRFQCSQQTGVGLGQRLASTARLAGTRRPPRSPLGGELQFAASAAGWRARQARGPRHRGDAPAAQLARLRRGPLAPATFIQLYAKRAVLTSDPSDLTCILHALMIANRYG